MYLPQLFLLGIYAPFLSAAAVISQRSVAQGWSLQSATCPSGTNSCGEGGCCPSNLHCFAAQTDEVASCCSSSETPVLIYSSDTQFSNITLRLGLCWGYRRRAQMCRLKLVPLARAAREWFLLPGWFHRYLSIERESCRHLRCLRSSWHGNDCSACEFLKQSHKANTGS